MVEGEYHDYLKEFTKELNFTVRKFKRSDGGWGSYDEKSGKSTGMISNIAKNEADLSSAGLSICCGRDKVVDFLWKLSDSRMGFIIDSE